MSVLVRRRIALAGHAAGQHVDIRLAAEDGYQAERSHPIASAPEDGRVALTVERVEDGAVPPHLADELRAGDELELRGPLGGHLTCPGRGDPARGERQVELPRPA